MALIEGYSQISAHQMTDSPTAADNKHGERPLLIIVFYIVAKADSAFFTPIFQTSAALYYCCEAESQRGLVMV